MLKYEDIISRLTDGQKIRILTSVGNLSGKDLKILGIPEIKVAGMKDYYRSILPHSTALSHSWNASLWQRVAFARAKAMASDGVGAAIVPSAKLRLSPFRRETSEDPYLSSELSAAHARGARAAGMISGVSRCYITEADVEFLDREPSDRVIAEFVSAPFIRAMGEGEAEFVMTDTHTPSEAYSSACRTIQDSVAKSAEFIVCGKATDDNTVDFISRGFICLVASQNALEMALMKYKKLKKALKID